MIVKFGIPAVVTFGKKSPSFLQNHPLIETIYAELHGLRCTGQKAARNNRENTPLSFCARLVKNNEEQTYHHSVQIIILTLYACFRFLS